MKKTKFFTYIIIITGIMMFIYFNLFPAINPATITTRRSFCAHNLREIRLTLSMYANANEGYYPTESGDRGLEVILIKNFTKNRKIFQCMDDPNDSFSEMVFGRRLEEMGDKFDPDYLYLGGFKEDAEPEVPILFDKLGNHKDFCNVLFSNGKVKGYELKYSNYEGLVEYIGKKKHYSDETLHTIKQKIKEALQNNKTTEPDK